jgi:hypothetical protein
VRSRDYPLKAAVLDRQGKRARSEAQLAAASRAESRAEARAVAAQRALEAHLAQRGQAGGDTTAGSLVALELKRSAAFARRHAREAAELRAAHGAALACLAAARAEVTAARAGLAQAYGAEQAIEHDRDRFAAAARAQARAVEQDELDEQRASRRPRPR